MNRKILLIILCLLVIVFDIRSQSEKFKKNNVGIRYGANFSGLHDRNFSPLFYYESGSYYALRYERTNGKSLFYFFSDFSSGKLRTKTSDHFTSIYIKGGIDLSYLRKTSISPNRNLQSFLGVGVQSFNHYIDYQEQEAFSFLLAHSVAFKYVTGYSLSNWHKVQLRLSIPVITLLVRPPYNGYDEELKENQKSPLKLITDGKIVSLGQYFAVSSQLGYTYILNRHFDLNGEYNFAFFQSRTLKRATHFHNQVLAGITFKF